MWYPFGITVAAASEPVTLLEAKAHCRIESNDENTLLSGYIAAARAHVEAYCGIALISRTISVKCDTFKDFAAFPALPLASVSAVSYVDTAGAVQTLSTDIYEVRNDGLTAAICLKYGQFWPSIQPGSRITVTAVIGTFSVPDAIKQAILLIVGHWFANREAVTTELRGLAELPMAVEALLANHRVYA